MNTYCVYMLVFPDNKIYLGRTKRFKSRMNQHKNEAAKMQRNYPLYQAINKCDWKDVKKIVLIDNIDKKLADKFEIYLIERYKSRNPEIGLNLTHGGNISPMKCFKVVKRVSSKLKEICNKPDYLAKHRKECKNRKMVRPPSKRPRSVYCVETGYIYPSVKSLIEKEGVDRFKIYERFKDKKKIKGCTYVKV